MSKNASKHPLFVSNLPSISANFKKFASNPFIFSMVAALLFYPLIPLKPGKYLLELAETSRTQENYSHFHQNIDNNNTSKELVFFDNENGSGLTILNHLHVEQWNVEGNFRFYIPRNFHIIGDYDNNGKNEIYFFSLDGNRILLHSIPDFTKPDFGVENRLITSVGSWRGKPDPFIIPAEMEDLDGDGKKELIFGIVGGFTITPRNIYAYFIDKDSLIVSPEAYVQMGHITQVDLDNDGIREIIPTTGAPSNVSPDEHEIHDHSSWLLVLDENLKFKSPPREYPGKYSYLVNDYIINGGELFLYFFHTAIQGKNSYIIKTNADLDKIDSIKFDPGTRFHGIYKNDESSLQILIQNLNDDFFIYDENLKSKRIKSIQSRFAFLGHTDLDNDNNKEFIIYEPNNNTFTIFREGFKHQTSFQISVESLRNEFLGIRYQPNGIRQLAFRSNNSIYYLIYRFNPQFYLQFIKLPTLYALFLLFALLAQRAQQSRIQERQQTERRMFELQLSHIRNQLNPHFTLNVLNNLGSVLVTGQTDKAMRYYTHFSYLIREVLTNSEVWQVTMREEVILIEHYLEIEKLRLKEELTYTIEMPESLQFVSIPKMLLFTFVENAIKHGLLHSTMPRHVSLKVSQSNNKLIAMIEDNGIGRINSQKINTSGTRKGLGIIDQIIDIQKNMNNNEVHYQIEDIDTKDTTNPGTRVTVSFQLSTSQQKPNLETINHPTT